MSTEVSGSFRGMEQIQRSGEFIPFWFWNDRLEKGKLGDQLADMKLKGINEVIIHARYGLPKETYLSEEWFDHVGFVLEKAKSFGMGIWLYDDLNWPSGTAGGRVRNTAKVASFENGSLLVREGTFKTRYDGFPYADVLSLNATDSFLANTHEEYYRRFPQYFGSVIKGFYHDERGHYANFLGIEDKETLPYSKSMEQAHVSLHGVELAQDIAKIFESESRQARLRYFETYAKEYQQNLERISQWCHSHGVALIGHLLVEENVMELVKTQADPFKVLSVFDMAGYDLIGGFNPSRQVLAARFAESVGKTHGKAVMAETFGDFGTLLSPEEAEEVVVWQARNGTDVVVPHALFYSTSGDRSNECPPNLMGDPIWAKMQEIRQRFASHAKERNGAETVDALYVPVKAIQASYNPVHQQEAERIAKAISEKAGGLQSQGIDFAILDDEAIEQRLQVHKRLHVPRATVMPASTLEQIVEFSRSGGTVVFYDGRPQYADKSEEQDRFTDLMAETERGDTHFFEIDRPERRHNVWNGIDPFMEQLDYRVGKLSPNKSTFYFKAKGQMERALGYIRRRVAR